MSCSGCSGREILLHDDDFTVVRLERCPFYGIDYSQEAYIVDAFMHYRNGHLIMPIEEWPGWLRDGMALMSHIAGVDEERKIERMKRSGR